MYILAPVQYTFIFFNLLFYQMISSITTQSTTQGTGTELVPLVTQTKT